MSDPCLDSPSVARLVRRRMRRDPKPRFKANITDKVDAVGGCPARQVPQGHLAWAVVKILEEFDYRSIEDRSSSLGRHGYEPRHQLGALIYGSLIGLHHASKVSRALGTDLAVRLVAGGHWMSPATLKRFRQRNATFLKFAIVRTVELAREGGLLHATELAVDSMRLRAHASTKGVRTVVRSEKRLEELAAVDTSTLAPEAVVCHEAKVQKHQSALASCHEQGRASIVLTNPSAALMKFPDGAGAPGHRVTVTAAGVSERFVVGVLVDAATNDYGKLEAAVREARQVLTQAGVPETTMLQIAADPGYHSTADLTFAAENRGWVDLLVRGESPRRADKENPKYFGRERFNVLDDGSATCPAGTQMLGPYPQADGRVKWTGVGCASCPQRPDCTEGKSRSLYVNAAFEHGRRAMEQRMQQADAKPRYNQRIATVEPVFSDIEDCMGYRRASSRHPDTIIAEVLLKILAHNISRLLARRKVVLVLVSLF